MELRIREFRKGDMDALYFLSQRCHPPERRPRYARILDTLLERDAAALVVEDVAKDTSRLIGGLIVRGDPWQQRLFIVSLLVDAEYRRLGIARHLLGWAERLGAGFRCRALLAPLEAGNAEGAAFLAAQGFRERDEGEPFFADPEQGRLWVREIESAEETPQGGMEVVEGAGAEVAQAVEPAHSGEGGDGAGASADGAAEATHAGDGGDGAAASQAGEAAAASDDGAAEATHAGDGGAGAEASEDGAAASQAGEAAAASEEGAASIESGGAEGSGDGEAAEGGDGAGGGNGSGAPDGPGGGERGGGGDEPSG